MKKVLSILLIGITLLTSTLVLSGCDDGGHFKPGGGGKLQPFDPGTGRYK